jgi:hypothetical protein
MDRDKDGRPLVESLDPAATDQPAEGGRAEAEDGGGSTHRNRTSHEPGSVADQTSGIVERGPQPDAVMGDDADAGAYVGRLPEGQAETIPGGVDDRDERVSAYASRREEASDASEVETTGGWPGGHREGDTATDDNVRRAGQNE